MSLSGVESPVMPWLWEGTDDGGHQESPECSVPFAKYSCLNLTGLPLTLCTILLALIIMILLIENGMHAIKKRAEKSSFWRAFMTALEGELTSLGLLSFTLFLTQQGLTGSKDSHLEHVVELVEFTHILLFLTMVCYLLMVAMCGQGSQKFIAQMRDAQRVQRHFQQPNFNLKVDVGDLRRQIKNKTCCGWRRRCSGGDDGADDESQPLGSFPQFARQLYAIYRPMLGWWGPQRYFLPRHRLKMKNCKPMDPFGGRPVDIFQTATVFLLADAFLRSHGLPRDLPFDYVEYLQRCTTKMFIKMIRLGWRIWVVFIITILLTAAGMGVINVSEGYGEENIDVIFVDDPNENWKFLISFEMVGWILMLLLFRIIPQMGKTFVGVVRRARKDGQNAMQNVTDGAADTSGDISILSMHAPLMPQTPGEQKRGQDRQTLIHHVTRDIRKGKTLGQTFCPCCSKSNAKDPYRSLFILKSPDFALRFFQCCILYYALFIALSLTVLMFVDGFWSTSYQFVLLPILLLRVLGGRSFPKYASIRFFGNLTEEDIFRDLLDDAWSRYREGKRRIDIAEDTEAIEDMYRMVLGEDEADNGVNRVDEEDP